MKLDLHPQPGVTPADQLFAAGVEFPCGSESACGGCRVRLLAGEAAITPMMRQALTDDELHQGWRLACCLELSGPVTVEVEQWSVHVLTDESTVALEPRDGLGAVIDLGTTTLVAQLVDLRTGDVLGVETSLNPQARFGADLMTRIQYELRQPGELRAVIRRALGHMLAQLAAGRELAEVLLCGNTAMHHLFCGLDVSPLASVPFESPHLAAVSFTAQELDWPGPACFLPCLGGFVGSDLLAGIVATNLDKADRPHLLFDIGTNGEIVSGSRHSIVCASTAAGPAFEGGRIGAGMRAGTGAIDTVHTGFHCHVIGGGPARGICGSGLVDAVAAALHAGLAAPNGRLQNATRSIPLADGVTLTQADIRELQLAKGAMAAGLKMLGAGGARRLWLAGAFGNYIKQTSARAIGLLPDSTAVEPVGNSALRGTRMLLLAPHMRATRLQRLLSLCRHTELAADPAFQDIYATSMSLAPFHLG